MRRPTTRRMSTWTAPKDSSVRKKFCCGCACAIVKFFRDFIWKNRRANRFAAKCISAIRNSACLNPERLPVVRGLPRSAYQSALNRVSSELGVVVHVHLFEDPRTVSADGLHAQRNLFGDLRDRH